MPPPPATPLPLPLNLPLHHVCEKDYIWNPAASSCENGKYLAIIMDDSAIACGEIIDKYVEEAKTISKNFNEKKATCKIQISLFYLYFY